MTEAKKSLKRTLIGKVVSDKRAKTVTVLIERRVKHELYGKIVGKSSKYHATMKRASSRWATPSRLPKAGLSPRPKIGLRPVWSRRQSPRKVSLRAGFLLCLKGPQSWAFSFWCSGFGVVMI